MFVVYRALCVVCCLLLLVFVGRLRGCLFVGLFVCFVDRCLSLTGYHVWLLCCVCCLLLLVPVCCESFVVCWLLVVARCLLFVVRLLPCGDRCELRVVCCLLFVLGGSSCFVCLLACCSLFVARCVVVVVLCMLFANWRLSFVWRCFCGLLFGVVACCVYHFG